MTWEEIKNRMHACSVGIAGAGGLGSNCAVALVRCGLGRLIIADFDRVEESNLNRQFYFKDQVGQFKTTAIRENLLRINPDLRLEAHQIRLTPENIPRIFDSVDLLIEAFDQAEQKIMFIQCCLECWPEKPVIAGSGMAGYGRSGDIQLKKSGHLYICGDRTSEINDQMPPIAPRVGIVASMQANVALEILLSSQ